MPGRVDVGLVEAARELAGAAVAEALPRRWSHLRAVGARAAEIAHVLPEPDRDVLVAAACLHDIGYAPDLARTGFHPLDGARFLRDVSFDARVTALVAHHSRALVEARLRGLDTDLAAEFPDERSPVTDALIYCDMTTGPDGTRVDVTTRLAEVRRRYGAGSLVVAFLDLAEPQLRAAVERVCARIATVPVQPTGDGSGRLS